MKLYKLAATALLIIMSAVTGTCFAIEIEDLNIGGICLGQPISEVIANYGEPVEKVPDDSDGMSYNFDCEGQIFNVYCIGNVVSVTVNSEGPLATKAGIRIGSTAEDVLKAYGTPAYDYAATSPSSDGLARTISYSLPTQKLDEKGQSVPFFADLTFGIDANNTVIWMSFLEEIDIP